MRHKIDQARISFLSLESEMFWLNDIQMGRIAEKNVFQIKNVSQHHILIFIILKFWIVLIFGK